MKRVTTKVVYDIVTGVVLHRESYLYDGPWALAMDEFAPDADAFRFYEDGTEAASSPIEDEDVNVTGRDVDSDSQIQLRYRVQEVGSGSIDGLTSDDYSLGYLLNGAGGWQNITATSLVVQNDSGSALTDGGATTNRSTDGISDGSGSFIAGRQLQVNDEMTNYQHTADNYTEHAIGLLLISADLANNDFVEFRLVYNGGNPGMANSAVPRVTVSKAAAGPGDDEIAVAAQGIVGQQLPVWEPDETVGY